MPSNQALDVEHLVGLVRALDAASLDPAGGRDLLVGLERLRNAAEAAQARVMVQMLHEARDADAADEAVRGAAPVPTGAREEFVVDEIAVHLRCTKVAASHRFAVALAADAHTPLHDGWAWGRLDARKVHVIGDLLLNAEPALAQTLAEAAVEYATSHTGPQLRTWLGRRVMAADPTAAELRRERATAGRHITLVPLPDGVAELSACMPAIQARHIFDTLTAVAHSTDGDDVRTLDQRRSDALYDLVTGRAEPPSVTLNVTVPATTLAGSARQPGELSGFGPLTAEAVGELGLSPVGDVRWRTLLIDPATGILTDVEPRYRAVGATRTRRPRARPHLPVPWVPASGHHQPQRGRRRPHHAMARRSHVGHQPRLPVPTSPPPQTLPRVAGRDRARRHLALDDPDRPPVHHPAVAVRRPTRSPRQGGGLTPPRASRAPRYSRPG